ncbi:MAG: aminotransferase class IV, partial [Candidatus Marinimicrobia bacterium]|nr:aminotransferase class IV [Candidatus Neomarinimicrobiota bacterium]
GFITECAIRNVFYIRNNTLITPALELGALPGVTREAIIEIAQKINIPVDETSISFEEINSMDEAFLSSTGAGILPCVWEGWNSDFELTHRLMKEFKKIQ